MFLGGKRLEIKARKRVKSIEGPSSLDKESSRGALKNYLENFIED